MGSQKNLRKKKEEGGEGKEKDLGRTGRGADGNSNAVMTWKNVQREGETANKHKLKRVGRTEK